MQNGSPVESGLPLKSQVRIGLNLKHDPKGEDHAYSAACATGSIET
jgi:hypothetical protein